MRIPFPERIPINRVAIFATALFAIQMLEGTALYFAAGCVVFILIATFAFNAAGGLTRASGAYVFSYSILVFVIGVCYKAFLGEPAQSNLADPHTDIEAYVGSIAAMYAAVLVSGRFSRKSGLLQNMLEESDMHRASVGCIIFGGAGSFLIAMLSAARLQSAFSQLNNLIPLGIIIGVMYEIRRSGGTRCTNLAVTLGTAYFFFLGATGFSKQGMIEPLLCWALPVCALRYRLSAVQIMSCLLAVFIVFYYLVPFSQYGRGLVPEGGAGLTQRVEIAAGLLEHPNQTRRLYYEAENANHEDRGLAVYFDTPQGFWERLQFISVDDRLIDFTDQGHVYGLLPLKYAFFNIVPHFLWPNKPNFNAGFMYVLEINGETFDPTAPEVGIAFSPTGEAYHLARWTGILVIAPLLWFTLFFVLDSLLGDLRATPWGLLAIAMISHIAPEGGIAGAISLSGIGVEIIVFCALFATWVAPILATTILGPDQQRAPRFISPSRPPTITVPHES